MIAEILSYGREMLTHPVETLPHAREHSRNCPATTASCLLPRATSSTRSEARSIRLGDFFDGVEIVSEKTPEVYQRVFSRHGDGARGP